MDLERKDIGSPNTPKLSNINYLVTKDPRNDLLTPCCFGLLRIQIVPLKFHQYEGVDSGSKKVRKCR